MRCPRPVAPDDRRKIAEAITSLRHARNMLRSANCVRALEKVRSALKSAEGAERHSIGLASRRKS